MSVCLNDLPPAYQAQALRKLREQEKPSPACAQKGSKYHNEPAERVTESGTVIRFDSQKEARRYDELIAMLRAGKIRDLKLQPQFTIQEAYTTTEGTRVRAIRYQADFSYELAAGREKEWVPVVEDVKSRATKTRVYAIKKKLVRERFGIDIQEI